MELFNDIHGDSGGYLHQTIPSISLQRRLATVGFTGTHGNTQNYSKRLIILFMTYNSPNHGICNVGQRFSAQFSFSLPIAELLSHISVLVLLCLALWGLSFLLKVISLSRTLKCIPVSDLSGC